MIDAAADPDTIAEALEEALGRTPAPLENPYGDGHAAERILEVIEAAPDRKTLLNKTTTLLD